MIENKNRPLTIKTISNLLVIRFLQQMNDVTTQLRPLYIEGHAGIGKSQMMKDICLILSSKTGQEVNLQTLNLQFCERPDFMGLPYIDEMKTTKFARPNFLPLEGYGILFLDEANRVDTDIQSGMLTLLEDRNINGHKLGKNWMIVLAGNPSGVENGVHYNVNSFDRALSDRVAKVPATGSLDDFKEYLHLKYPNHILLQVLDYIPDIISFNGEECSPRAFEYAIKATKSCLGVEDPYFKQALNIELGDHTASQICAVLQSGYIPTLRAVLANDKNVFKFIKDNPHRNDIIISLIDQVFFLLQSRSIDDHQISDSEVSAITELIISLQHEHRLALFEKIRGSKCTEMFKKHFLSNTRLAGMLYAKRTAAA